MPTFGYKPPGYTYLLALNIKKWYMEELLDEKFPIGYIPEI
jgi:hypothetical protein